MFTLQDKLSNDANLYRRGEGLFKKRDQFSDVACSRDPSGQKYEFRETDLRLNRNRGNGTPKPFLTVSNSGMLVIPFMFSFPILLVP